MKSCAALTVVLALFACADASANPLRRLACGSDEQDSMCACYAGCENKGHSDLDCDADDADAENGLIVAASMVDDLCSFMMCSTYCSNANDCWDDDDKKGCEAAVKADLYGKDCDIDCSGGVAAGVTFAVAMMVFGAH